MNNNGYISKKIFVITPILAIFIVVMLASQISIFLETRHAFAWVGGWGWHHHWWHHGWGGFELHHTYQSIDQGCIQPTRSSAFGGFDHRFGTPVNGQAGNRQVGALSHNNVVTCVNVNFGGNAAVN